MNQLWTTKYIEGIIKELEELDIQATFFITGQDTVDHGDKCEQVRTLVRAGHEVQLMNWNGNELHPNQSIDALQIDDAMEFFRDCLGNKLLPIQLRPIQGQITLDQARAVSQRYRMIDLRCFYSANPDHRLSRYVDCHVVTIIRAGSSRAFAGTC